MPVITALSHSKSYLMGLYKVRKQMGAEGTYPIILWVLEDTAYFSVPPEGFGQGFFAIRAYYAVLIHFR